MKLKRPFLIRTNSAGYVCIEFTDKSQNPLTINWQTKSTFRLFNSEEIIFLYCSQENREASVILLDWTEGSNSSNRDTFIADSVSFYTYGTSLSYASNRILHEINVYGR